MKNPLAVALGNSLRELRNKLNISSEDIIRNIGVNEAYYRLIESGGNTPHVNKTFDFISTFNSYGANLAFESFLKVLMAIHFTQPLKKALEDKKKEVFLIEKEKLLKNANTYDKKMYALLYEFDKAGVLENLKKTSKEVIDLLHENKLDIIMFNFLNAYESFGKQPEDSQMDELVTKLRSVPTIHGDYISSFMDTHINSPIVMGSRTYQNWESANQLYFTQLDVLATEPEATTYEYNFKGEKYQFLWNRNFNKTCITVVDNREGYDATYHKAEFKNNFKKIIKNDKKRLPTFDEAIKKVNFSVITSNYKQNLQKELLTGISSKTNIEHKNSEVYNTFWVYTLRKNEQTLMVGFLGDINFEQETQKYILTNVISLSFEYLNEKLAIFKSLKV